MTESPAFTTPRRRSAARSVRGRPPGPPPEPDRVAHPGRPSQSQLMPHLLHQLRGRGRTEHDRDGVAPRHLEEAEDEERYQKERGNDLQNAPEEVSAHVVSRRWMGRSRSEYSATRDLTARRRRSGSAPRGSRSVLTASPSSAQYRAGVSVSFLTTRCDRTTPDG